MQVLLIGYWQRIVLLPAMEKQPGQQRKNQQQRDFFGLLSDWKIDTQAFRDEMRD